MNPGIAIPILPARDLIETRRFYERLNFEVVGWWPDTFGGYAILTRGDLAMHFFHYPDLSPLETYAQCYWRVADVEALYTEVHTISRCPGPKHPGPGSNGCKRTAMQPP